LAVSEVNPNAADSQMLRLAQPLRTSDRSGWACRSWGAGLRQAQPERSRAFHGKTKPALWLAGLVKANKAARSWPSSHCPRRVARSLGPAP